MVWIRADANSIIGTGHMMRALSLAAALKECGEEVLFLTADESAGQLLADRGQAYKVLGTAYDRMETELDRLLFLFAEAEALEEKPKLLLIDSYFVTENYLKEVRKHVKTAYIDDKFIFPYPVDILINYNIYGDMVPYRENGVEEDTVLLLGTQYAPLRSEFEKAAFRVRDKVRNVLLTTGGSDRYNLAGQILNAALLHEKAAELHYHVVSGVFNSHLPELQALAAAHENVHIHENVQNMAELMEKCDIAVTAGGSTMYELCAVGVPVICFSFVDNQEKIVETFAEKDIVCFGGNYLTDQEGLADKVIQNILKLASDKMLRQDYQNREKALVDGRGAARLAKVLCEKSK